jgi:hypothetical protein
MRQLVRRLAVLAMTVTAVVSLSETPALAVTNPYTPEQACHDDLHRGGTWSRVSDGTRAITTPSGARWGTVYLMYNAANGFNCVATIKSQYVGTSTLTGAFIWVDGNGHQGDGHSDFYQYYETFAIYARGSCVQYWGEIYNPSLTVSAIGGRFTWGNCG